MCEVEDAIRIVELVTGGLEDAFVIVIGSVIGVEIGLCLVVIVGLLVAVVGVFEVIELVLGSVGDGVVVLSIRLSLLGVNVTTVLLVELVTCVAVVTGLVVVVEDVFSVTSVVLESVTVPVE